MIFILFRYVEQSQKNMREHQMEFTLRNFVQSDRLQWK